MCAYACLDVSEMSDSNNSRDNKKELQYFFFFTVSYSHYPRITVVLLKIGLDLL
jgi:hypothetical protein